MADVVKVSRISIPGGNPNDLSVPNKLEDRESISQTPSISISEMSEESNDCPATKLARSMSALQRVASTNDAIKLPKKAPQLVARTKSCPQLVPYDDCKEFVNFAGEWVDSKGQEVLISAWGVIRYPSNAKLRFEAIYMGPNHLSVTFDKDPKRRKFVGKLNHECTLLIWSNDTKWVKKGCKIDPRLQSTTPTKSDDKRRKNNGSCLVM